MAGKVHVITGVERRRRFSDDEKQQIVDEAACPGAAVSEVARRHGISASLLFSWRKAFARGTQVLQPCLDPTVSARIGALRTAVAQIRAEAGGTKIARFPRELSHEALSLIDAGLTAAEVVMATGLPPTTLSRWRQQTAAPQIRELRLRPDRSPTSVVTSSVSCAVVRIGHVRVELPIDALHDEGIWQQLTRLGGLAS